MKRPVILFVSLLVVAALPAFAAKRSEAPVVGIMDPVIEGDLAIGRALADTLFGNISLSLDLTGKYVILDEGDFIEIDADKPQDLAVEADLDSVLFGRIEVKKGGGFLIEISLYDRRSGKVILNEVRETKTYLEVFEASDSLTLSILTAFSGSLPQFGSLRLNRQGPARDFHVEIDGRYAGTSPAEISWLPVGKYRVRIYEKIGRRFYDAATQEVEIRDGEASLIEFSLMAQGEFERLASTRFLAITGIDVPFQVSLGRVTAEEIHTVFSWGLKNNRLIYDKGQIYLAVDDGKGGTDYGPLLIDMRVTGLKKLFGGSKKSKFIVRKDGFSIRPGREADIVNQITWYGAVVYCQFLSEMEGLESCYNLEDWSCDFSKNGYRLPTEKEWVLLNDHIKKKGEGSELFEKGSSGYGEWCWDFFTGLYLGGKSPVFKAGPEKGHDAILRFTSYRRKRFDQEKSTVAANLRIVRTLPVSQDIDLTFRHDPWPRTGVEPWVLGYFQQYPNEEYDDILALGVGCSFHWNYTSIMALSGGLGLLFTNDPDLPLLPVMQLSPLIFGNVNSFAVGMDYYLFLADWDNTDTSLGRFTVSFTIYFRKISVRFFFFDIDGFFTDSRIKYYTFGGGYTFGLK